MSKLYYVIYQITHFIGCNNCQHLLSLYRLALTVVIQRGIEGEGKFDV